MTGNVVTCKYPGDELTSHTINSYRMKSRPSGIAYDGQLYPCNLPVVPNKEDDKPVIYVNSTIGKLVKRFIVHQELTYKNFFDIVNDYVKSGLGIETLREPFKNYASVLKNHINIPSTVILSDDRIIPREQWLYNGVSISKPKELCENQIQQLTTAAFWINNSDDKILKDKCLEILEYYNQAGHTAKIKRPYVHRKCENVII